MSKHTPGPWVARGPYVQIHDTYKTICCVDHPFPCGTASQVRVAVCEVEANARLIAAAPELLEELESLVEKVLDAGWHEELVEEARAVIEKAREE